MQRKAKFKIGNIKNTENLTSHHFTYIKKVRSSPGDSARNQTHLGWTKARSKARLSIRASFSFQTPPLEPPFFFFSYLFILPFFQFESGRANVLSNKYLFNIFIFLKIFQLLVLVLELHYKMRLVVWFAC